MTKILKLLVCGAALSTATAALAHRDPPEVQLEKMLAGREAGKPVDCINMTSVSSSTVIEGKAIVYTIGGKLYVNEPRGGAKSLRDDDVLVTHLYGSQLCSIDSVRLVDRVGHFPRGFVTLGKFVPYSRVKTAQAD